MIKRYDTGMKNAKTNAVKMTIYEESFGNMLIGTGSLVVKQLDRNATRFALIGYLPAGMDIAPFVFARGALDDCRREYKAAKAKMDKWFPIN